MRRLMRELRHQEQPSTDTSKTTLSPDHRQRPESIPSPDHPQRPESIPPSNQPQPHNQEQLSTHTSESTSPYRPQRPHFTELIRLAEERGQIIPRVELDQSTSNSYTSQDIRLMRYLSSESSTGEEATEH